MNAVTLGTMREMFSREAEQAVLGAVLLDGNVLLDVIALGISIDHFGSHAHKQIWSAVHNLGAAGEPVDAITVAHALSDAGQLDGAGGIAYLGDLADSCASPRHGPAYARRLLERHTERQWCVAGREVLDAMMSTEYASHAERIGHAQAAITLIAAERRSSTQYSMDEALRGFLAIVDQRHDHPGIHGVCTGFHAIDSRLHGLGPGDLVIVAGRPSMGKTTFAMNCALHTASAQKNRVLVFSLEMSAPELAMRFVATRGPAMGLLKSGRVLDYRAESDRLATAVAELSSLPILIDDQGGLTLAEIATRARREHRSRAIRLIVVDYLQLIAAPAARGATRNDVISDISRGLKSLAKELGCPVVVLSQLSRKCEERNDKRPILSDLRDSGAVEQDADIVQFIYRDRWYNQNTGVGDQAEIITAKHRNGECGTDYLIFDGAHNCFRELQRTPSGDPRPEPPPLDNDFRY